MIRYAPRFRLPRWMPAHVRAGFGGPYNANAVQDLMYAQAIAAMSPPRVKYLALDGSGNNSNSGDHELAPYATGEYAVSQLTPGSHLVVLNGTINAPYDGGWMNSPLAGVEIPSGPSWAEPTVIRAKNRFAVRINQETADYDASPIHLGSSQNVWIDGFVLGHRPSDCPFAIELGSHNTLTRTAVLKTETDEYGGWVSFGTDCCIEDCLGFGAARYGFKCGSAADVAIGRSCLRRLLSHYAFTGSGQPKAAFAVYGADNPMWDQIRDVCLQNCFDVDSPAFGSGLAEPRWASFLTPKSVRAIQLYGCGSLNCGVAFGAFRSDNVAGPDTIGHIVRDSFVWGMSGDPAIRTPGAFSGAPDYQQDFADFCTAEDTAGIEFSPNYLGRNSHPLTSGVVYPVQRVGGNGAEQLWQIGAFRSRFGDAGYNTPQIGRRLWPFPYEDIYAALMSTPITKPVGYYPLAVTQTGNPFATQSFTERVWRAAGAAMPDLSEIYA